MSYKLGHITRRQHYSLLIAIIVFHPGRTNGRDVNSLCWLVCTFISQRKTGQTINCTNYKQHQMKQTAIELSNTEQSIFQLTKLKFYSTKRKI